MFKADKSGLEKKLKQTELDRDSWKRECARYTELITEYTKTKNPATEGAASTEPKPVVG